MLTASTACLLIHFVLDYQYLDFKVTRTLLGAAIVSKYLPSGQQQPLKSSQKTTQRLIIKKLRQTQDWNHLILAFFQLFSLILKMINHHHHLYYSIALLMSLGELPPKSVKAAYLQGILLSISPTAARNSSRVHVFVLKSLSFKLCKTSCFTVIAGLLQDEN